MHIIKMNYENAVKYQVLGQNRKETIQKYCWDETTGFILTMIL